MVVDHDAVTVGDAQLPHAFGEVVRRGQHVGQGIGVVLDRLDIEQDRAGDVLLLELFPGRARIARHEEGRRDDAQVRLLEPGGQPVGGDDRIGHGHSSPVLKRAIEASAGPARAGTRG